MTAALNTHDPSACEGQSCCIHNPSAHHMVTWPQHWRADRYLMERTCPHGIGHPDPDHMAHIRATRGEGLAWGQGVHGCDGCCKPTMNASADAEHGRTSDHQVQANALVSGTTGIGGG